jgi:hypothetical protein
LAEHKIKSYIAKIVTSTQGRFSPLHGAAAIALEGFRATDFKFQTGFTEAGYTPPPATFDITNE